MSSREAEIRLACEKLANTLVAKNRDYGDSVKEFGSFGILVRLVDKLNRLRKLMAVKDSPNYESIEDSFLDTAGYGILGYLERKAGR